jgi:hypothetical protein
MKQQPAAIDRAKGLATGTAGFGAQLRAGPQFGVDADDHVSGLHLVELVGHLVSRRRAGRRRVHYATHVLRQG